MMINDDYTWMLQNYRFCHWERDDIYIYTYVGVLANCPMLGHVEPKLGIELKINVDRPFFRTTWDFR